MKEKELKELEEFAKENAYNKDMSRLNQSTNYLEKNQISMG